MTEGYKLFLAMGMLNAYDLNCSDSVVPNYCVLTAPLPVSLGGSAAPQPRSRDGRRGPEGCRADRLIGELAASELLLGLGASSRIGRHRAGTQQLL